MSDYFRTARCLELSTIKYIEESLEASWEGLTVVKSFSQAYTASLPIVSINLQETLLTRREVGSTTLEREYIIKINIFATSDGQRIDLADFILDKLKDSWTFYLVSHASGSSSTMEYTDSGKKIWVHSFDTDMKIEFDSDAVDKYDKFRHLISVNLKTGYYG